jgi:hypothetical protein
MVRQVRTRFIRLNMTAETTAVTAELFLIVEKTGLSTFQNETIRGNPGNMGSLVDIRLMTD